jgi:hypothetical protein
MALRISLTAPSGMSAGAATAHESCEPGNPLGCASLCDSAHYLLEDGGDRVQPVDARAALTRVLIG